MVGTVYEIHTLSKQGDKMDKERAKVLLGALQMIEPLVKDGADFLATDAFCLVWNEIAQIAEPIE